jgi:hypothetical protein
MSLPKNQHWVPQFYLKHFAIPETRQQRYPRIWTFRLNDGYEKDKKIKNVAASDYLYSPPQPDGTRCFRVDSKVGSLENDIAPFWVMIADGTFNLDGKQGAKKLLSLFIAILHLRNPKMKQMCIESHLGMAEITDSMSIDSGSGEYSLQIADQTFPIDTKSFQNVPPLDETALTSMFTGLIEDAAIEFAKALLEKQWLLAIADAPVFITSDVPVVMFHRQREKFGYGTKGTEFLFPISPTRLLHIHDQPDFPGNQFFRATPWLTAVLNIQIAGHAQDYAFSHDRVRPVLDAAMRMTDPSYLSKATS